MKNTDRVPVPPSGLIEIIGYAAFYRILCRMVFGQLSGILWSVPGIQFRLWITIHRVLFPSCRRYLVCRGPFEFDVSFDSVFAAVVSWSSDSSARGARKDESELGYFHGSFWSLSVW